MKPRLVCALTVVVAGVVMLSSGQGIVAQGPPFSTPRQFKLVEATIPQIQAAFETHFLDSKQLVKLYLDRIAAYNPMLNAVGHVNPAAVTTAHWLDVARAQRQAAGPLWGIPVLLKDNIDTGDMPTTAGSVALEGSIPPDDAFVVKKLRAAGAIIIGKATLSEFANYIAYSMPSGYSSLFGYGYNPYEPRMDPRVGVVDSAGFSVTDGRPVLTTGGSSSGSAIGVSTNMVSVAIGTETSGSILSPASQNGVVGIKPTVGLVSRDGIIPITADQDTAGPIARTVTDAAILLGAMAGYDPSDAATMPCLTPGHCHSDYTQFLDSHALRGARIGYDTFYWNKATPDRQAAMDAAIALLQSQGATVIPVSLAAARAKLNSFSSTVLKYGMKRDLNLYLASLGPDAPVKTLADVIAFNKLHLDVVKYGQGLLLDAQAVDLSPGSADTLKYQDDRLKDYTYSTEGIDGVMAAYELDALISSNNNFASMPAKAGYPSITVPTALVQTIPASPSSKPFPAGFDAKPGSYNITFTAKAWSEPRLIALAYAYEQARRGRVPPWSTPALKKDVKGNPK
ncbi:MAG: amidase family protein [Bacteroidales bacterium]